MANALLFPIDPLNPRRVDSHFAREARAARELGLAVALVDHDALLRGDAREATRRVPEGLGPAVYRGWMVPVRAYEAFDAALRARGAVAATTPDAYARAHELPGWYEHFAAFTPRTALLPLAVGDRPDASELAAAASQLPGGAAMVKDWVKSRKHEWDTACFVPDLADTAGLASVVDAFLTGQGVFLTGGVALRAYEEFTGPEARVWWVDAVPVLSTAHPDSPGQPVAPPLSESLRSAVAAFEAPFVTTDLALRADGVWRVVEVGDGQVSDLPATTEATELLGALATGLNPPIGTD
ncbi:MAG TPA: ATP-grasp domain-containing protein [Yinghuangia sp.]|uniref:ATP-grasp domain-containing protein n=1 Tax=Yinghuangia sp. YIM S10712 TaxID=3436930 RepID=UPI002CD527C9|nr:ATP-grasp domain-containing protein [Yinghuangia sp.]